MTVAFPHTVAEAATLLGAEAEIRAGGTDVQERLHLSIARERIVDLRDVPDLDAIGIVGGELRVGAMVRVAELAESADVARLYPGLSAAARGLATPQIRNVGTVGGNLLQRVRCWYFRSPDVVCYKKGGGECRARTGDHLYHSCFDLGPCVAPHPSTLGVALLAYDGRVTLHGRADLSAADLFGDGSDPTRENTLSEDDIVTGIVLPAPPPGEGAAYVRAIARAQAEWPLVEAIARVAASRGVIRAAAVAVGAVANIPLRLAKVEGALAGREASAATLEGASALAADGASPLPMTRYKVDLLVATVLEALEQAVRAEEAP